MATPILDNHLHLHPGKGKGIDAVQEFARSGGTHMLIVNQPSWKLDITIETPKDFDAVFAETLAVVDRASDELPGRAWPVLGVHPALISRLIDDHDYSPTEAADLMCRGLTRAADYAANGPAVALKSGRPHYEVTETVWTASNTVIKHALDLAAETGVAVQLHTEATEDLTEIAAWAEAAGLPPDQVVKHYANGTCTGVTASVISREDALKTAADHADPFLMETDFLDDPDRPGAVLGPRTVPRRTEWLREHGYDEAIHRAHVETPQRVYGIDTSL